MRLISIAGRDRRALVELCLASVAALQEQTRVMFHRDPLTTEYDDTWLFHQGVDIVDSIDLPVDLPPRQRVARMRCVAALCAREFRFDSIFYVDSDVILDSRAINRLEELEAMSGDHCDLQHGARSLGNYPGYEAHGYLVKRYPPYGVSIRTHALGGCLEFPVTDRLVEVAQRGVPEQASWDTWFSREVARRRVLTSEISYARHLGMGTGINAERNPHLNWQKFTPELEKIA